MRTRGGEARRSGQPLLAPRAALRSGIAAQARAARQMRSAPAAPCAAKAAAAHGAPANGAEAPRGGALQRSSASTDEGTEMQAQPRTMHHREARQQAADAAPRHRRARNARAKALGRTPWASQRRGERRPQRRAPRCARRCRAARTASKQRAGGASDGAQRGQRRCAARACTGCRAAAAQRSPCRGVQPPQPPLRARVGARTHLLRERAGHNRAGRRLGAASSRRRARLRVARAGSRRERPSGAQERGIGRGAR